jgi:hypothetical protein
MMDRRTFLAGAAATPLVFGLDRLGAAQTGRPEWYDAALRRMKEAGRFGVLIVVPDGDPAQQRWGMALWDLAQSEIPAVREVLCEAVFITARFLVATTFALKPGDGRNRFLLDPSGKIVEADTISLESLEDGPRFAASFRKFVHGESDERLRAQAGKIDADLPAGVREAVARLDSDDLAEREAAEKTLREKVDAILPWLVERRQTASTPEAKGRIAAVIGRHFAGSDPKSFGPRLPYGARIPKIQHGCGVHEVPEGQDNVPTPPCGLAEVGREPRKFLRFLSK